ncbi:MAG: hypothetical protein J5I93_28890 [Pirellulaceae bacterium]|nr:hypothetical protein [Pirellulaceae bacterium]
MLATLSHYSIITLPATARASLVFPGAVQADPSLGIGTNNPVTLGYVRCPSLVASSWKMRTGGWEDEDQAERMPAVPPKLPFRDYPAALRVQAHSVADGRRNVLIVSARNTLNEVHYQARIDGVLYRTARDQRLSDDWPVLCLNRDPPRGPGFSSHGDVGDGCDFVSGLPLVIGGRPSSRSFLVAHSSDVAHSFRVDPQDRFGTPGAWLPVSDEWNRLHSHRLAGEQLSDDQFTDQVDAVARRCGLPVGPNAEGNPMPHSIVAERDDGVLQFLVISASLQDAASCLARQHYRQAIVLDQSGSVGHSFVDERGTIRTLVSTSNYRSAGTCFLAIETQGFLGVARHPAV